MLLWASLALAAPRVAVVDLQNRTGDPSLDGAGAGVSGVLLSKLVQVDSLEVVERDRLEAVLGELGLAKSGAVDPATAAKAGKLLGATHLVTGDVSSVKLPTVSIALRVVEVQTGKVVVATDVVGQVGAQGEEFFVLVDDVALRIVDALEVQLGARDRIELSQVQVEKLQTIGLYGRALQALDRGEKDTARALLTQALTVEPGFRLAEDTLKAIATEIAETRAEMADAAVTRVRTLWDTLEKATTGTLPAAPSPEQLADAALRARMRLVRGDLEGYLTLENERITKTTQAHVDAAGPFDTRVRTLVTDSDVRSRSMREILLPPVKVRQQMVAVLLLLGRKEAAAGMIIDLYQHPGPLHALYDRAPHPADLARRNGLVDLAVVARRQLWEQAKRTGRTNDIDTALRQLDDAVKDAQSDHAARARWDTLAKQLVGKADLRLVGEETAALRGLQNDPSAAVAAHRAFLARTKAGFYDGVRGTPAWGALVDAWVDAGTRPWNEPWFADQQLALALTTWDLDPPADEEARTRRSERIRSRITGAYGK